MAINGTNGDDEFFGTRFGDEINGLEGNDIFQGSRGQDVLNGNSGNDGVDYCDSLLRPPPIAGYTTSPGWGGQCGSTAHDPNWWLRRR